MSTQQASRPPPSGAVPGAQPPAAKRGGGLGLLLLLVLMLCLVFGSLAWLLGTRSGLAAAIALGARVTAGALQVEGAHGRLLGPLQADRVRYHNADLRLELESVELRWQPEALLDRRLLIERLAVVRIDLAQRPADEPAQPLVLPDRLELPLALEISELEVGRFALQAWAPEVLPSSAAESAADASAGAALIADAARTLDEASRAVENVVDVAEQVVEGAPEEAFWVSDLRAAFDSDGRHHNLRALGLSVAQGRAQLEARIEGITPFALAATGRFDGELEGRSFEAVFTASEAVLNPHVDAQAFSDGLEAHAVLDLAPFTDQPLRALKLKAGEVDPAAFVKDLPTAALSLDADLAAAADGSSVLAGRFNILNQKPAAIDEGGIPLVALSGRLDWRTDSIGVDELDIRLPGDGHIGGQLAWRPPVPAQEGAADAAVAPAADVAIEAQGLAGSAIGQLVAALELAGIDTHALDKRLPRQSLSGRIDAEADAQRQQAVLALKLGAARVDARVELTAEGGAQPAIELGTEPSADGLAQEGAEVAGAAPAAFTRRLSVHAELRNVDPRALLPTAPSASLNLDVDANAQLPTTGLPSAVELDFRIPDSRIEGLALAGEGRLQLEGERLPALQLALRLAGNTLSAEGGWGAKGDVLRLVLDAPRLAALGHDLGGRAGASAQLSGTLDAPTGELQFFGEALRLPGSVRVLGLNGVARLDAGAAGPFQLAVGLSGLGPLGKDPDGVALPDWLASARVSASGTRARHEVALDLLTPARDESADSLMLRFQGGLQDGSAQASGSARSAGPRWLGELLALETAGRVGARLQAPARLTLSPSAISLGTAEIVVEEQGRVRLQETTWSPQLSVVRGSLSGLGFGTASARERPANAQPRRGPGPLMLGAEWDLSMGKTLDGQLRVFRESGDLALEGEIRTQLGLEALEAVVNARGDRLTLTADARGSEFGSVHASARVRARRGADGMWSLPGDSALMGAATLDMPSITWLGRLLRENVETAGSLNGRVGLGGTLEAPLASGQLDGEALQVALVDQGLILSGGEFRVSFDHDYVRLERLAFVSPNRVRPRESRIPFDSLTATPGQFTASGEVRLDSGAGDFSFRADRLPLLQREDRWMILSGEGSARSTWTSLELNADFRADAGYIELAETLPPSLSDDVVVLGREQAPGGEFVVTADVGVSLGDALYLSAMGLETRLAGELNLRLRPGHPLSAVGTIATVGGSYRGYGQSLSIERGVVNFQGPLDAPGLNIVALRKGLPVEAGVSVSGSAKRPLVRLVSEPNVPDPEKLSWIVLGRAPDAGAGADLGLLLPAAQALLGGPGGGMTDELSRSLGFDSFSIGQGELNSSSRSASSRVVGGGSTISSGPSVSSQVLSVGKRLDTDLFLSFEQSLGGAETLVKLSYQLSRRLSLIARGGTDNALDLHYSFSWR